MSPTGRALPRDEPRTVADLPPAVAGRPALRPLQDVPIPEPVKEPVDADGLAHRDFDDTPFRRRIPAFAAVDRETFLSPAFRHHHGVTGGFNTPTFVAGVPGGGGKRVATA